MNGALVLDGMHIPVEVGETSRRARLTIERDGSLRLRAAADVGTEELEHFLRKKREWIYGKLAEKESLHAEPIIKEFADGEGFLYLGRNHQLRIVDSTESCVRLERGRLILPRRHLDVGHRLIIEWYCACGRKWLQSSAREWAQRLGVDTRDPEVADIGFKWGAVTPDRRIRIHWATLQLRPELVDYVVAHELAHLQEPHHGPSFWALLGRVMPDYEDRRTRLAQVGANLWTGTSKMDP